MDHSLATLTKAVVAFIPHESLHDLTARFPNLAAVFWRDTLIDAGIFREWLVSMGRRSAFEHVAHLFCELYLKLQAGLGGRSPLPAAAHQTDLADALGLTPVHINRVLKEMRGRTLITLRSQMLVIEAWDELLRVSEFDPTYLQLEKRRPGERRLRRGSPPRGGTPSRPVTFADGRLTRGPAAATSAKPATATPSAPSRSSKRRDGAAGIDEQPMAGAVGDRGDTRTAGLLPSTS